MIDKQEDSDAMLTIWFSNDEDSMRDSISHQSVHLACTYTIFQLKDSKASGRSASRVMDWQYIRRLCSRLCSSRVHVKLCGRLFLSGQISEVIVLQRSTWKKTVCSLKIYGCAPCKSYWPRRSGQPYMESVASIPRDVPQTSAA
jgi:hypothetical protein